MSRAIKANDEVEIIESITLVMRKTGNSFDKIMQMKYGVFLAILKHIRIDILMKNPEWREAYLKWQVKEAYKNGNITKQTKPDFQGLMSLQAGL